MLALAFRSSRTQELEYSITALIDPKRVKIGPVIAGEALVVSCVIIGVGSVPNLADINFPSRELASGGVQRRRPIQCSSGLSL